LRDPASGAGEVLLEPEGAVPEPDGLLPEPVAVEPEGLVVLELPALPEEDPLGAVLELPVVLELEEEDEGDPELDEGAPEVPEPGSRLPALSASVGGVEGAVVLCWLELDVVVVSVLTLGGIVAE
jgi:hypothetical protein